MVASRCTCPTREPRVINKLNHERTADWSFPVPLAQERRHRGAVSGSLDDTGTRHHVGVTASFRWAAATGRRDRALSHRCPRRASVGGLGGRRSSHRWPQARGGEPLERKEGPQLGAAARRAGVRGRLRPSSGRPLPSRDDVPAVATRSRAGVVHLRTAGDGNSGGRLRCSRRRRKCRSSLVTIVSPRSTGAHRRARRQCPRPTSPSSSTSCSTRIATERRSRVRAGCLVVAPDD